MHCTLEYPGSQSSAGRKKERDPSLGLGLAHAGTRASPGHVIQWVEQTGWDRALLRLAIVDLRRVLPLVFHTPRLEEQSWRQQHRYPSQV
jgi:hypothetical protein